jgi:hypothetical protein
VTLADGSPTARAVRLVVVPRLETFCMRQQIG